MKFPCKIGTLFIAHHLIAPYSTRRLWIIPDTLLLVQAQSLCHLNKASSPFLKQIHFRKRSLRSLLQKFRMTTDAGITLTYKICVRCQHLLLLQTVFSNWILYFAEQNIHLSCKCILDNSIVLINSLLTVQFRMETRYISCSFFNCTK